MVTTRNSGAIRLQVGVTDVKGILDATDIVVGNGIYGIFFKVIGNSIYLSKATNVGTDQDADHHKREGDEDLNDYETKRGKGEPSK